MPSNIKKTGEIAPLGVRMQPGLKEALTEAARKNGRSVNAEIVLRLEQSLVEPSVPAPYTPGVAENGTPPYNKSRVVLTQCQEMMLDTFDRLPPEKQLALISLFK